MLKILLILVFCFYSALIIIAQDMPKHSIAELNFLLKESKADTGRVSLLLEAGLTYVLRQGTTKTDMDSAVFYINSATNLARTLKEPGWEARCWYMYSQLYRETGEIEKGKKYIQQAIDVLTSHDLKSQLADAYIEVSQYYDIYADSDSDYLYKIQFYKQAEALYRITGEKQKQASALKNLADFHQIYEEEDLAIEELQQSLAIYQSINCPDVQGVYDLLGYVCYLKSDYKQALKYGLLAVQTAEKVSRITDAELSTIYNRVGGTYYQLRQYEEANRYLKKALTIAMANNDTGNVRVIAVNVVNTYMRLKKNQEALTFLKSVENMYATAEQVDKINFITTLVGVYWLMKQPANAESYIPQLHQMAKTETDPNALTSLNRIFIQYYYSIEKYTEMYDYLPAYEKLAKQNGPVGTLADSYFWWFKADSSLGNYLQAISHYKMYKEASDSALKAINNKQVAELLIGFETEKKDKDIQLLTKQGQIQQSKLEQASLIRNVMIAGAFMLALLLGISYNRYRLKQRNNKKLQLQQQEINEKNSSLQHLVSQKDKLLEEKEWLLKEIHHRVKNNMQVVMSLLNTQSAYLENDALTAIKDSQHRMQAMSLIHQKLYQGENVAFIQMPAYIHELTDYLGESYDDGHHIRFDLDIEAIELDVAQAVPVGLILNEAITNAIKYAFPNTNKGTITVVMQSIPDNHLLLCINDNGIGLPAGFDNSKNSSLGMNLMRGLVKQLEGSLTIKSDEGLGIRIEFPHDKTMRPISGYEILHTTIETSV